MKIFKKGFNYSQDGPGNRLVYHLQGCNFRCKWCSNPEGMGSSCPTCKEYTTEELMDEIKRSQPMFFDGGGVTFTGGEATVQFEELAKLLKLLKMSGISTAVETNGSHPRLESIFGLIDYLIMDVKHFDSEKHKYWTGDDGKNTYENLKRICSCGRQALIRIPVINGVNDDAEKFAEYFENLRCFALEFEFLAYHEFGKNKWNTPYEIENGFVSDEVMRQFEEVFRKKGFTVVNT